ncbi:MAG: hypothetical protein U1F43_06540 [Myxococcota bacterium]
MTRHPGSGRLLSSLSALLAVAALGTLAAPARAEFPQVKINAIDTSEAPKIRVWASLLGQGLKPAGEKAITGVTLFKKPDKTAPVEMFGFNDGEVAWPKGLTEEEIKAKPVPEMALAGDLDKGASIVVIAPGFQDPEYRNGSLGTNSRNGTGLFFKKLGKTNKMNVIWYNDYTWTYVYTEGRTAQLSKLDPELEKCRKWERDQLNRFGMTPEEQAAMDGVEPGKEPAGPKKNEARCGLTSDYATFGDMLKPNKAPYDGFWPNLFGLQQKICMKPEQERRTTTFPGEGGESAKVGVTAIDAALEMLVKDGDPSMPRILILTGDGRDGYIKAADDCKSKYQSDCANKDEIKALNLGSKEGKAALKACVDKQLQADINVEQSSFAKKLPTWLALAKAANIRIYSVIHPTAAKYQRERLEVLAWRTGGTARVAEDANQVLDLYDDLIGELNKQVVLTFTDDDAKPGTTPAYQVEVRVKGGKYTSDPFTAPEVAPPIEKSLVNSVKDFGQKKLGKVGFIAVLAAVGVILLVLLLKLGKKIFGGGADKLGKAAKGGKDAAGKGAKAAKDKAKLLEKAKKMKEAQKKAIEKAKKKAGG